MRLRSCEKLLLDDGEVLRVVEWKEDCYGLVQALKVLLQSSNKMFDEQEHVEVVEERSIAVDLLQVQASRTLVAESVQKRLLSMKEKKRKRERNWKYIPLAQVDVSFLNHSRSSPSSLY